MREVELVVDELVKWSADTPKPNLAQIEEVVLRLREQLGEKVLEALIEQQEAKQVDKPR